MPDRLTPEQRRRCMQANRGSNTGPEIRLRKALHAEGFRYVLRSKLPGRPDLVFPSLRTVVFVDGCFWHSCPQHLVMPQTDQERWARKLALNVQRDRRNDQDLSKNGWKVVRIWEHDVRRNLASTVKRVSGILNRRRKADGRLGRSGHARTIRASRQP